MVCGKILFNFSDNASNHHQHIAFILCQALFHVRYI